MHQKVWIFDGKDTYIGSANMDWRALRQVKELGIVIENDRVLAAAVIQQFDVWWGMASLDDTSASVVWDSRVSVRRSVPSWPMLLPEQERAANPLLLAGEAVPVATELNMTWNDMPVTACVSASPPEFCLAGRATALDRVLNLVDQAQRFVYMSFMNLVPVELTLSPAANATSAGNTTYGWSSIADALINAMQSRGVSVRILVSMWAHTPPDTVPAVYELLRMAGADAAAITRSLEIRWFALPGWDETVGAERNFAGHSRVNHPKFAISESRALISTNNMTWESFYCNAGISFDTGYSRIVRDLLFVFDRDWFSGYTKHFL
jgi:phospholipase D3/4